jgi:hypothetical protein
MAHNALRLILFIYWGYRAGKRVRPFPASLNGYGHASPTKTLATGQKAEPVGAACASIAMVQHVFYLLHVNNG